MPGRRPLFNTMTQIATAGYAAVTWVPRTNGRAFMSAVVAVQGDTETVIEDLATELRQRLAWGSLETVIAIPPGPTGALMAEEAPAGALVVSLDVNQAAPEFAQGNPDPDYSHVRLSLEQVVTRNLDDRPLLMSRRKDLRREFHTINGNIGA